MTEHTPGKWQRDMRRILASPPDFMPSVGQPAFVVVQCGAYCSGTSAEKNANARLIEAACNACMEVNSENPVAVAEALPDLLAACEGLLHPGFDVTTTETGRYECRYCWENHKRAISVCPSTTCPAHIARVAIVKARREP